MKAEGQARLEPPKNPGCASLDLCACAECTWSEAMGSQRVTAMDAETGPALGSPRACCFVLGHCVAPIGGTLAFRLVAMALHCPALPLFPRRSLSASLMLKLCNYHCPQSLVGRCLRSSGSSDMLWATSGSPRTHGIEQGRNHLLVRDAR